MSNVKIDKALLAKLAKAPEAKLADFPRLWPKSSRELSAIIKVLTERRQTYGTCVYAMALAAEATYNLVAHKLGVTGFQASCADMRLLARNRSMKHGFRIIDYGKLLYPQYKREFDRIKLSAEQFDHIRKAARALLDEEDTADPNVAAHWAYVAYGGRPFDLAVEEADPEETREEKPKPARKRRKAAKKLLEAPKRGTKKTAKKRRKIA
jgi:hypothetical protein